MQLRLYVPEFGGHTCLVRTMKCGGSVLGDWKVVFDKEPWVIESYT